MKRLLPIVKRELRVRSRKAATYRIRSVAAGVAFILAAGFFVWGPGGARAFTGFGVLSGLVMLLAALEGIRNTFDCISEEKREGTLGFLFQTDLRGYEIVLGKLAATSLSSLLVLAAVLPMLGLLILKGGITGGEFARMTAVFVNGLFLPVSIGMWISSRSWDQQRALLGTLSLLIGIAAGLPLIDLAMGKSANGVLSLASPIFASYLATDIAYRADPSRYWMALSLEQGLSWFFIGLACWDVRRHWQEGRSVERVRTSVSIWRRAANPARRMDENPFYWFSLPRGPEWVWPWALVAFTLVGQIINQIQRDAVTAGGSAPATAISAGVGVTLLIAFAAVTTTLSIRSLAAAKRSGALELILTTPLSVGKLIGGQWNAWKRQFAWPIIVMISLQFLNALSVLSGRTLSASMLHHLISAPASTLLSYIAMAWVGWWLVLSGGKSAAVIFRVFLLVILFPWLMAICVMMLFGSGGVRSQWAYYALHPNNTVIIINLLEILWARRKLFESFRPGAAGDLGGARR